MATNPSDVSVRFNDQGHLCGTQVWAVEFPRQTVTLILAYLEREGVKVLPNMLNRLDLTQTFL